jgi:hypothetical protein
VSGVIPSQHSHIITNELSAKMALGLKWNNLQFR